MAQRVMIQDSGVFEGELFEIPGEDGPLIVCKFYAGVTTVDGQEMVHQQPLSRRADAQDFVDRVQQEGSIDPQYWRVQERTTLEERWAMIADQEDEVRYGFRPEDDLYHGIPMR